MSRIDEAMRRAGAVQAPVERIDIHMGGRLQHYTGEPRTSPFNRPARDGRKAVSAVVVPPGGPLTALSALDPTLRRKTILGEAPPPLVEQFRRLAVAVHELQVEQGLRMLLVTSTLPNEGKTLTAVNLALTLSESCGRRVLLVDADLRRPFLHKIFQLPNDRGLAAALISGDGAVEPIRVSQNLTVLPAGTVDQPMALASDRLSSLLERWAANSDVVLIDAAPVGVMPDAQLLARLTRAVLFVIAAHATPEAMVTRAIAEIGQECVIGTVLNGVDDDDIPAADYYNAYYPAGHSAE